jgi:hypothetical protein
MLGWSKHATAGRGLERSTDTMVANLLC